MWHFANGKPNKVWIWKAYDLKAGKTFAWKLGKQDAANLNEFLDEIELTEETLLSTTTRLTISSFQRLNYLREKI
jgi:IS1 family transposase